MNRLGNVQTPGISNSNTTPRLVKGFSKLVQRFTSYTYTTDVMIHITPATCSLSPYSCLSAEMYIDELNRNTSKIYIE